MFTRAHAASCATDHAALNRLKSKAAHFEKKMTRNVGFATGIEFRESTLQLNAKNETRVRPGMTFNVAVGLEDLEDKQATDKRRQKYALFLADTVLVMESGPPETLTEKAPKAWTEVSYHLNNEEEATTVDTGRRGEVEVLESRTRGAGKAVSAAIENSEALSSHQAELEETIRIEALERLRHEGGNRGLPTGPLETPTAYNDANGYPTQNAQGGPLRTNMTYVDGKAETVLIPIFGQLVPFHVSYACP